MNHRLNPFPLAIWSVVFICFVSACSPEERGQDRKITIGFAAMNVEMTWMKFAYRAINKKAVELGVDLITYDANNNVYRQAVDIEDLIDLGVDAIITDPVNVHELTPTLESASKKGIPIVAFDRSATGAPYLFFVGSDDVEAGRLACRFIARGLKGKGRIVVLEGAIGSSPAINRSLGFYDEIKKYPDMKVVFRKSGGFLRDEGYRVMREVIATVADFDAIYSQDDDMVLGALEAMKEAGIRPEDLLIIGTDAIPEALIAIKEGRLDATIQYPISQVDIAMERLVEYLRTGTLPAWKEYLVKPWIITSKNISTSDFYSELQN